MSSASAFPEIGALMYIVLHLVAPIAVPKTGVVAEDRFCDVERGKRKVRTVQNDRHVDVREPPL